MNLEDEIYEKSNKSLEFFKSFDELKNNNKYVQNISDDLNKNEQEALLKLSNIFIKREFSRGLFASNYYVQNKFLLFPELKILDLSLFLHELNHAISHNIIKNNYTICSIAGINKKEENSETNKSAEKYYFLNEIITDYFVGKMNIKSMEDNKVLMHSSAKSSYSRCFVLIESFMRKYFKETKECFINSDSDLFEKLFGKHNLEALEQLFKDFSGYSQTMLEKNGTIIENFEEGFKEAMKIDDAILPSYVTKYFNSFLKMENLMQSIERYQKNNNLETTFLN